MAFVNFPGIGIPIYLGWPMRVSSISSTVADAVGESCSFIGRILLPGGPGTSKTISGAGGGSILWNSVATSTFANAASTVRVGIQDVNTSTGVEDGTYDVNADLTGGGGGIANGGFNTTVMTTGSKTIAHGDTIAVVIEMTARGGVDSIRPGRQSGVTSGAPYCAIDTGAGPNKTADAPYVLIIFDDGTVGYFGDYALPLVEGTTSFNSGSTPDEYALIFQVPMALRVSALLVDVTEIDVTETGEAILYTDPTGTPVAQRTQSFGPGQSGQEGVTQSLNVILLDSTYDLAANTDYAIAYRATSTGNRTIYRWTLQNAASRAAFPFGTTMQGGQRTDQTGAFGSLSTTVLPRMGLIAQAIDITPTTTLSGYPASRAFTGA